jgi:hypothetical protein
MVIKQYCDASQYEYDYSTSWPLPHAVKGCDSCKDSIEVKFAKRHLCHPHYLLFVITTSSLQRDSLKLGQDFKVDELTSCIWILATAWPDRGLYVAV